MSTATKALPQAPSEDLAGAGAGNDRVYRGRSVAELIPRIQADLGPEAIVLRRRNGLQGGIGGFFQRPFVEIEARSGSHVDFYDGEEERPPAPDRIPAPGAPAADFSALQFATMPTPEPARSVSALEPASPVSALEPAPSASALEPAPPASAQAMPPNAGAFERALAAAGIAAPYAPSSCAAARSKTQLAVIGELIATGIDQGFAEELVEAATVHVLAFSPRIGLRKAVRIELERRIPTAAPLPMRGAAIVLVGPGGSGKTRCVASLAAIYRRSGALKASCATILVGAQDRGLQMLLSPHITTPAQAGCAKAKRALATARSQGLALIDTPSLSPAEKGSIKALGQLLGEIAPDRVVVALPATLSGKASAQLLGALAPLKPGALAITHADETDQLGIAVQAACEFGLAPEYMLSGGRQALTRIDPSALAQRLLR